MIQYAYLRAEDHDARSSMTAAVGSFVFPQGGRIVLPIVAFVLLQAARGVDTEALVITGISLVLVALIGVVVWLIGRSERSARWLGGRLGRLVSWVMVKLHREPVGDLGDQVVDFRNNACAVDRQRWLFGSVAVALNLFVTYLILFASVRFVGIEQAELGLAAIFAGFAVAFLPVASSPSRAAALASSMS